jgi:prefoldin beta subunit
MTEENMPQQLQDQINRLQQLRTQLQMLTQQNQQVELRIKEIEEALDELDKADSKAPIYKSVGSVLIKTNGKTEVIKDLKSTKESLDIRKSTLSKQEGRTREKLNELQSKVQNAINLKNNTET